MSCARAQSPDPSRHDRADRLRFDEPGRKSAMARRSGRIASCPTRKRCAKIDVDKAITALDQAAGRMPPRQVHDFPGLGGSGAIDAGDERPIRCSRPPARTSVEGIAGLETRGEWKPQSAGAPAARPERSGWPRAGLTTSRGCPATCPTASTIYLRQSDYFPLRIDYCRTVSKSLQRHLLSLKFSDVNFSGPIDSSQFLFMPGSLEYSDRTDEFLRSLGQ